MINPLARETNIIITGGEKLAGLVPELATPNLPCDILVNDLRDIVKAAEVAAKLPIKILNMANKLIMKVANEALALTDAALHDLEHLVNLPLAYLNDPSLDFAAALTAMNAMLNCAYVLGNKDLYESLKDARDMVANGYTLWKQLPHMFMKYVGNAIKRGAYALIYGQIACPAIAKLNSISKGYSDMLRNTGITKALRDMNNIVYCIAGGCTAISALEPRIDALYSKLGLNENGDPLDIFVNSSVITASKKYTVSATMTKLDSLYAQIDAFGLF